MKLDRYMQPLRGGGGGGGGGDPEGIGAVGAGNQGAATAANDAAAASAANSSPSVSGIGAGAGIGVVDAFNNVHGFTGSPAVNDSSPAAAVGAAMAANPQGFAMSAPATLDVFGVQVNPVSTAINSVLGMANPAFGVANVGLGIASAMGLGNPSSIGNAVTDAVGFGSQGQQADGVGPSGAGNGVGSGGGYDPFAGGGLLGAMPQQYPSGLLGQVPQSALGTPPPPKFLGYQSGGPNRWNGNQFIIPPLAPRYG